VGCLTPAIPRYQQLKGGQNSVIKGGQFSVVISRCPHGFKRRLRLKPLNAVCAPQTGHNFLKQKQNHGLVITSESPAKPRFSGSNPDAARKEGDGLREPLFLF